MSLFDRDRSAERMPVGVMTGFLGTGKIASPALYVSGDVRFSQGRV